MKTLTAELGQAKDDARSAKDDARSAKDDARLAKEGAAKMQGKL